MLGATSSTQGGRRERETTSRPVRGTYEAQPRVPREGDVRGKRHRGPWGERAKRGLATQKRRRERGKKAHGGRIGAAGFKEWWARREVTGEAMVKEAGLGRLTFAVLR